MLAAAEALDYHAHGLLRRRLEEMAPEKTLGFVLQKRAKWFYRALDADLRAAAADRRDIRARVDVDYVEALAPDEIAAALMRMADRADTVALVSVDHPAVSASVAEVAARGVPVFALLSPLTAPALSGTVGIDGRKAGRTAGWVMSRLVARGTVGILIGSHRYRGQEDRETGFRAYLREMAPEISLRDSIVYLDDAAVAYEASAELLSAVPDLAGLYHVGGGVEGAIRALQESGRGRDVFYICHEATPASKEALADGTADLVLATPTCDVAREAVALMASACKTPPVGTEYRHVAFQIVTPENLQP